MKKSHFLVKTLDKSFFLLKSIDMFLFSAQKYAVVIHFNHVVYGRP